MEYLIPENKIEVKINGKMIWVYLTGGSIVGF
jgi:hypothetical protein